MNADGPGDHLFSIHESKVRGGVTEMHTSAYSEGGFPFDVYSKRIF